MIYNLDYGWHLCKTDCVNLAYRQQVPVKDLQQQQAKGTDGVDGTQVCSSTPGESEDGQAAAAAVASAAAVSSAQAGGAADAEEAAGMLAMTEQEREQVGYCLHTSTAVCIEGDLLHRDCELQCVFPECKTLHDDLSVMRFLSSCLIEIGHKGAMGGSCSKAGKKLCMIRCCLWPGQTKKPVNFALFVCHASYELRFVHSTSIIMWSWSCCREVLLLHL